ncbi:MAG: hypothetical protein DRG83_08280 [Deltaproteobacteria bacterium]|nr:MAG: hypothetical protein DRG83_08280 [Deltaproteobacteria bacterium]
MEKLPLKINLTIPGRFKFLSLPRSVAREVCSVLSDVDVDEKVLWAVELAVSEAVTNAMKYGCGNNGLEAVEIEFALWDDRLEILVIDLGKGFDWGEVVDPDFASPKEGGYGLYIIKELMDKIEYKREKTRNILKLVKYLA